MQGKATKIGNPNQFIISVGKKEGLNTSLHSAPSHLHWDCPMRAAGIEKTSIKHLIGTFSFN
jgi:hypothetical protein